MVSKVENDHVVRVEETCGDPGIPFRNKLVLDLAETKTMIRCCFRCSCAQGRQASRQPITISLPKQKVWVEAWGMMPILRCQNGVAGGLNYITIDHDLGWRAPLAHVASSTKATARADLWLRNHIAHSRYAESATTLHFKNTLHDTTVSLRCATEITTFISF